MLHEVRSWDVDSPGASVEDLARRFRLDPLMVQRLLEAEGLDGLLPGKRRKTEIDPRRVTTAIEPEMLDRARSRAKKNGKDE
jgi:hypothetical protein